MHQAHAHCPRVPRRSPHSPARLPDSLALSEGAGVAGWLRDTGVRLPRTKRECVGRFPASRCRRGAALPACPRAVPLRCPPAGAAGEGPRRGQSPSIDKPVPGPPRAAGEREPPRTAQRTVSATGQGRRTRGAWGKPGAGERMRLPLARCDAARSCDAAAGECGLRLLLSGDGFPAGVVPGRSRRTDGHEPKGPGATSLEG